MKTLFNSLDILLPSAQSSRFKTPTKDDISRNLKSMGIWAVYRARGGIANDRDSKLRELNQPIKPPRPYCSFIEGDESALVIYEDKDSHITIDWSKICSLTENGTKAGHERAKIIELLEAYDKRYVTYALTEADGEELVINLLAPFSDGFNNVWVVTREGHFSLQWIVESKPSRKCTLNGSTSHIDAMDLPYFPKETKELKLCGMDKVFIFSVPHKKPRHADNPKSWIHEVVRKLEHLDKLTVEDCGHNLEDMSRLKEWLSSLEIIIKGGKEVEQGIDIVDYDKYLRTLPSFF